MHYFAEFMGRSDEARRAKRRRQKEKRKIKKMILSSDNSEQQLTTSSSASYDLDCDHGIDKDVLEMKFEDGFRQLDEINGKEVPQYSTKYLLKSREILMSKVEHYRQQLDQYELEKRRMALETRKTIENVKTFYKNIALGPTRTGRIVKAAIQDTHTAKTFLKEVLEQSTVMYP